MLTRIDKLPDGGRLTEAAECLRLLHPCAQVRLAWGHLRYLQRRAAEALEHYRASISLGVDPSRCAYERWMCWMLLGEFERAWQISDTITAPLRVSDLAGKRVLVRCEHGLGDTVQFLRYAPLLARYCRSVDLQVQPELARLYRPPDAGPWDASIECMQLPYVFRTTLATVPAEVPYLAVPRHAPAAFASLYPRDGFRTGLVWSSGTWNPERSVPLAALAPLAAMPGVSFFSLQHGPEWRQAVDCTFRFRNPPEPLNDDAAETAAAIVNLDLVITVNTVVAHLAGALGHPVWLLLPHAADWRWLIGVAASSWYPTMRLFRQPAPVEWAAAIGEVARELRALALAGGTTSSPFAPAGR